MTITWCMPSWSSLHFSMTYQPSNELDFCIHGSNIHESTLNVPLHRCLLNTLNTSPNVHIKCLMR